MVVELNAGGVDVHPYLARCVDGPARQQHIAALQQRGHRPVAPKVQRARRGTPCARGGAVQLGAVQRQNGKVRVVVVQALAANGERGAVIKHRQGDADGVLGVVAGRVERAGERPGVAVDAVQRASCGGS